FRSTASYDHNSFIDRQFSDSVTPLSIIQGGRKPVVGLDTTIKKTITNSNVLNFSLKGFKKIHDIDMILGEETYDLRTESRSDLFRNYPLFTAPSDAFK